MSTQASAIFKIDLWEEEPYDKYGEEEEYQLAQVTVRHKYSGDIEGESLLHYLMSYSDDGLANFVGLERVTGRLGERAGSFVLMHSGAYAEGEAKSELTVAPGSASGELRGLRGKGHYSATHADEHPLTLEYWFE